MGPGPSDRRICQGTGVKKKTQAEEQQLCFTASKQGDKIDESARSPWFCEDYFRVLLLLPTVQRLAFAG